MLSWRATSTSHARCGQPSVPTELEVGRAPFLAAKTVVHPSVAHGAGKQQGFVDRSRLDLPLAVPEAGLSFPHRSSFGVLVSNRVCSIGAVTAAPR